MAVVRYCLFCSITLSIVGVTIIIVSLKEATSKIPTSMIPSADKVTSISRLVGDTAFTIIDLMEGAFGRVSMLPIEDSAEVGSKVGETVIGLEIFIDDGASDAIMVGK